MLGLKCLFDLAGFLAAILLVLMQGPAQWFWILAK
jgi:hypothetical protein